MNKEIYVRVGQLLRLERESRGIDLGSVASELKVGQHQLEYIEDGLATELPAELYFHLFAKSYAAFLGIDYNRTLEAIKSDLGEDSDVSVLGAVTEPEAEIAAPIQKKAFSEKSYSFLILILLVSIAVAWGAYNYIDSKKKQAAAGEYENAATNSGGDEYSQDRFIRPYDTTSSLSLSILARVGSYALILADGDTAVRGELEIGKNYQIDADRNLVISIGTPEAVDVRLNGQRATFVDPFSGRVGRVEVNLANYQQFIVPEDSNATHNGRTPQ